MGEDVGLQSMKNLTLTLIEDYFKTCFCKETARFITVNTSYYEMACMVNRVISFEGDCYVYVPHKSINLSIVSGNACCSHAGSTTLGNGRS